MTFINPTPAGPTYPYPTPIVQGSYDDIAAYLAGRNPFANQFGGGAWGTGFYASTPYSSQGVPVGGIAARGIPVGPPRNPGASVVPFTGTPRPSVGTTIMPRSGYAPMMAPQYVTNMADDLVRNSVLVGAGSIDDAVGAMGGMGGVGGRGVVGGMGVNPGLRGYGAPGGSGIGGVGGGGVPISSVGGSIDDVAGSLIPQAAGTSRWAARWPSFMQGAGKFGKFTRFGGPAIAGIGLNMLGGSILAGDADGDTRGADKSDFGQFLQGAGTVGSFATPLLGGGPVGWAAYGALTLGGGLMNSIFNFSGGGGGDVSEKGDVAFAALTAQMDPTRAAYFRTALDTQLALADSKEAKAAVYQSVLAQALTELDQKLQLDNRTQWATDYTSQIAAKMPELYAASNARIDAANAQYLEMARHLVGQLPEAQQNYMNQAILYDAQANEYARQQAELQRQNMPYQLAQQLIQDDQLAAQYGYDPYSYAPSAQSVLTPLAEQIGAIG